MNLSHIIAALEEFAPLALQEKWDNSGLQIGLPPENDGECTGVMLCVDVTPEVIAEARSKGCNLVVSHHPLIFKGLKCIAGRTLQERAAADAIRAGIAVYSSHTALDSAPGGVSYEMASRIGARVLRALVPSPVPMVMMSVICPRSMSDDVRLTLLDACPSADSFDVSGNHMLPDASVPGTFSIVHEPLCRVDVRVAASDSARLSRSLSTLPGGEKIKVTVVPVDNDDAATGLGVVAVYEAPLTMKELVERLHREFSIPAIKASRGYDPDEKVRVVALCGGAGGEFIGAARAAGVNAYITADVRYHDFSDLQDSPLAVFDIGHFESERCAKDIFYKVINNKFPNFKVLQSESEQSPVLYL